MCWHVPNQSRLRVCFSRLLAVSNYAYAARPLCQNVHQMEKHTPTQLGRFANFVAVIEAGQFAPPPYGRLSRRLAARWSRCLSRSTPGPWPRAASPRCAAVHRHCTTPPVVIVLSLHVATYRQSRTPTAPHLLTASTVQLLSLTNHQQVHHALLRSPDGCRLLEVAVKVVHPRVALRIRQVG